MNIRTRQTALILLVLVLGGVAAAYYAWRWTPKDTAADRWHQAAQQGSSLDEANGLPYRSANAPAAADLAAPVFQETPGPSVEATETHFVWTDAKGRQGLLQQIDGCLSVGPGVDVVWHGPNLYLAKEPGKLRRIWSADASSSFRSGQGQRGWSYVCYDGQYVWAPMVRPSQPPRLVVVDPRTEEAWEFTNPDGSIPTLERFAGHGSRQPHFAITPLGPGKICAVNTAWIGTLEFAPPAKRTVETIPTSRWLEFSQQPAEMFKLDLPTDAGPRPIVVYGRAGARPQLLIDVERRSVQPAQANSSWDGVRDGHYCLHDGSLWWIKSLSGDATRFALARASLPELEEQVVALDVPAGLLSSIDGRLCAWGRRPWRLVDSGPQAEMFDLDAPWEASNVHQMMPGELPTEGQTRSVAALFTTQHDGLLALTNVPYGKGDGRLYRLSIGGPANRPALAAAWPVTSVLTLSRIKSSEGGDELPLAVLTKAAESLEIDHRTRLPLLAREIARQSLLLAARHELRWRASDGGLSDSVDDGAAAEARWRLDMRFTTAGQATFALDRLHAMPKAEAEASADVASAEPYEQLWQEELNLSLEQDAPLEDTLLDYGRLATAAERWSREVFPIHLIASGPAASAAPVERGSALGDDVMEKLARMSFPTQYLALRRVDALVRSNGESDDLLVALVRGYAHLGFLTDFHWTCAPEVFQARSLLIAQRFAARLPRSPLPLWCLAYAKALAGLHGAALEDLASAERLAEEAGKDGPATARPEWVELVDAYCRFDAERIERAANSPRLVELATLLYLRQFESMKTSFAVQQAAMKLLEVNPECYLVYDRMCDCCALGILHTVTAEAPEALRRHLPARLATDDNLPPIVLAVLEDEEEPALVPLLADALASVPLADDDSALTWSGLGSLVRETHFLEWWRRAYFLKFQLSVPTDDFVEAVSPLVADHRYHALIGLTAEGAADRPEVRDELLDRLDLSELKDAPWTAMTRLLDEQWQADRPREWLAASARPALHRDDVCQDLADRIVGDPRLYMSTARQIVKLSPFNPDAALTLMYVDYAKTMNDAAKLEREHAGHPRVLLALSEIHAFKENWPDAERLARQYIKFSPDMQAYQALAKYYKADQKLDQWRETLDEFLQQESNGLEHAHVQVELANYFMDRREWSKALPYAEAAAGTWARWAMLCAIRCYQALGDDEQEGLWRARVAERYPSFEESLNYFFWARRAGRPEAAKLAEQLVPQAQAEKSTTVSTQYRLGAFYLASGRLSEALAAYRAGAVDRADARSACFCALWAALAAEQAGDDVARAAMLAQVAGLGDPALRHFSQTARWLEARIAAAGRPPLELAAADEFIAAAPAADRAGENYFVGRYLELTGHFEEAIKYLQAAATAPEAVDSMSRVLACAALHDHGIAPEKIVWPKPPAAAKP